ncbi:MAG: hypothetical protein SNJ72_10800 [Fimbriimonadales bacterium]
MVDWDTINREAEKLAKELRRTQTDLGEAEKLKDYYLFKDCDEDAVKKYLDTMADNPPERSKKTQRYYHELRRVWNQWNTPLKGIDKARAWGLAVKIAKSG